MSTPHTQFSQASAQHEWERNRDEEDDLIAAERKRRETERLVSQFIEDLECEEWEVDDLGDAEGVCRSGCYD